MENTAHRASDAHQIQNSATGSEKAPNWTWYFEQEEIPGLTKSRIDQILSDFDTFGRFIDKLNGK